MQNKHYSPHILIYKPQTNSTFSLFLRFILLVVFFNFIFSVLSFNIFSDFVHKCFLDLLFTSELIFIYYVVSSLAEDFIDFDDVTVNYLDVDLISIFKFFFNFFILLLVLALLFLICKTLFWTALIAV